MSAGVDGLPGGWTTAPLADVGKARMGKTILAKELVDNGLPVFSAGRENRPWGYVGSSDLSFGHTVAVLSARGSIGFPKLPCSAPFVCTQTTIAVDFFERTAAEFYTYWLATVAWEQLTSGASIPMLTVGLLNEQTVPVAPLNEQRRIVAKIEALQARASAAKEALDAIPPLLEKFRQSVLAAAFRGDLTREWREAHPDVEPAAKLLERIRAERKRRWVEANPKKAYVEPEPVDTEGLPELPGGWCWVRWEQVGFCQNGRAFPSEHYMTSGGTKLLRPGNLGVSGVVEWTADNTRQMPHEWATEYPRFLVGPGELVINLTAQSLKDEFLGRVCLTGEGEQCLLNQRIGRLTPVDIGSRFCLWLFKSNVFRRYVEDGLNTGSLIQHMFTSQVDNFVFPLPPEAEQRLIAEAVDARLALRSRVFESLAGAELVMRSLTQSILSKAFRGELVPQDPNDEPASALLDRIRRERDGQGAPPAKRGRGRPKATSEEAK